MPHKYVYLFANGVAEGQGAWRDLLGGKGAGLAEMTALGIRVPARLYHFYRSLSGLLCRRQPPSGRHVG